MNSTARSIIVVFFVLALGAAGVFIYKDTRREAEPLPLPIDSGETPKPVSIPDPRHAVIGTSVLGRTIDAYSYGSGKKEIVFVGGIHGGYEWNSVLLAYQFMDYLSAYPATIPSSLTLTVIPNANPDGVHAVTGTVGRFSITDVPTDAKVLAAGRFNANTVDLNRNFDCKWQPKSVWQSKPVSGGTSAFSEPESAALRDFMQKHTPAGVVFWHSQAGAVFISKCEGSILPDTRAMMLAYSKASGYAGKLSFDSYTTTGAADDWLASIGIPAITVELETHATIEWSKNLAGIKALLVYFDKPSSVI